MTNAGSIGSAGVGAPAPTRPAARDGGTGDFARIMGGAKGDPAAQPRADHPARSTSAGKGGASDAAAEPRSTQDEAAQASAPDDADQTAGSNPQASADSAVGEAAQPAPDSAQGSRESDRQPLRDGTEAAEVAVTQPPEKAAEPVSGVLAADAADAGDGSASRLKEALAAMGVGGDGRRAQAGHDADAPRVAAAARGEAASGQADADARLRARLAQLAEAAKPFAPDGAAAERMPLGRAASAEAVLQRAISRLGGGGISQGATDGANAVSALPSPAGGAGSAATVALAAGAAPMAPAHSPQQLAETAARLLVQSVSEGKWQASLRLDPPDLGRVEVQIGRDQNTLSAHFVTATSGARAALEQAMPQLAQQLDAQGMSLGDASVSQQGAGDGSASGAGDGATGAGDDAASGDADLPLIPESGAALRARGLFEGWA